MRDFHFRGIAPSELASQLATVAIRDLTQNWLAGQPVACDGRPLARYMGEVQHESMPGFPFAGTGALNAGGTVEHNIKIHFSRRDEAPD